MNDSVATIFSIQRFSTEDGPGIRTTVFFKGCPLTCPWCHNPEGMSAKTQVYHVPKLCISCGDCIASCPKHAIDSTDGISLHRDICDGCGTCVKVCPASAWELVGKAYTLRSLVSEVLKDRTFYETSGGGVTISGGEPMQQSGFATELLDMLQKEGIHTALDTSGASGKEAYKKIILHCDLVLFDLKTADRNLHRNVIGIPFEHVEESLQMVVDSGVPFWIRTPLIPGYTADEETVLNLAKFIEQRSPAFERWDLLAFSNLCTNKYERLGMPFALLGQPLLSQGALEGLASPARKIFGERVRISGPTRKE